MSIVRTVLLSAGIATMSCAQAPTEGLNFCPDERTAQNLRQTGVEIYRRACHDQIGVTIDCPDSPCPGAVCFSQVCSDQEGNLIFGSAHTGCPANPEDIQREVSQLFWEGAGFEESCIEKGGVISHVGAGTLPENVARPDPVDDCPAVCPE